MWQYNTDYLCHHGILGQKWGIRRFQNPDGTLTEAGKKRYGISDIYDARMLPKHSTVYRVSSHPMDPTGGNRKYVSLTKEDHKEWKNYLGKAYKDMGYETYDVTYKTNKNLNIASYKKLGDLFIHELSGKDQDQMIKDTQEAEKIMGYKTDDLLSALSLNIAAYTKTGESFINTLRGMNYQGIEDVHGRNVSKDPIIIFDPDKNLKKKSTYINNYT